jgi:SAM-dependent methyltransferase
MSTKILKAGSHPKTRETMMRLIGELSFEGMRVLELGAGSGLMSQTLEAHFHNKGYVKNSILAVDLQPEAFGASNIPFERWDLNESFSCGSEQFDLVFSIEVIEHLQNPYKFIAECERVLRPGGVLILTTPNNLHIGSRFKYLRSGFPNLYEPPSTAPENAGRLCGHIMPIHAAYVDYGLRRVGLVSKKYHVDKEHGLSLFLFYFLYPMWMFLQWSNLKHTRDYDNSVFEECREVLEVMGSRTLLTSRSLIVSAIKSKCEK